MSTHNISFLVLGIAGLVLIGMGHMLTVRTIKITPHTEEIQDSLNLKVLPFRHARSVGPNKLYHEFSR